MFYGISRYIPTSTVGHGIVHRFAELLFLLEVSFGVKYRASEWRGLRTKFGAPLWYHHVIHVPTSCQEAMNPAWPSCREGGGGM